MDARVLGFVGLLSALASCGGCEEKGSLDQEGRRLWGRDQIDALHAEKANEALDAYLLGEQPALRSRVLEMTYGEVMARLGFVEYQAGARFELERNQRILKIVEDTTIRNGLHGSFRILQKDEEGAILRESIFNNGVYYVRNGPGDMRVHGIVDEQHTKDREQAYEALRVYTSYYGPRLGLRKTGRGDVAGRGAAKYAIELLAGPDLVTVPGMRGAKRPVSLSGELFVDEATGVPLKGTLKGRLEVPTEKGVDEPGRLDLSLSFQVKTVEGAEIKPDKFVPTVKRREVDLDPLAFVDGGVRTSTVIGGKKPTGGAPPAP